MKRPHRLADAGAVAELAKERFDRLTEAVAIGADAQRRPASVEHGRYSRRRLGPGEDEQTTPDRQRRRLKEFGQGDAFDNDDVRRRDGLTRRRQAEITPVDASRREGGRRHRGAVDESDGQRFGQGRLGHGRRLFVAQELSSQSEALSEGSGTQRKRFPVDGVELGGVLDVERPRLARGEARREFVTQEQCGGERLRGAVEALRRRL